VIRWDAVLKALGWLLAHDSLYRDVVIDTIRISALPEEDVLNYNIEHIPFSVMPHALISQYAAPNEPVRAMCNHNPMKGVCSLRVL
jgi:hypothetical protein